MWGRRGPSRAEGEFKKEKRKREGERLGWMKLGLSGREDPQDRQEPSQADSELVPIQFSSTLNRAWQLDQQ